jgi:succinate dehydrogenase / fumarate reductase iron-sulfur subunit
MTEKIFTFHILRFNPTADAAPYFQDYTLAVPPGLSVLEALVRIQTEQDGTLAFRYACRGAVCGSCAMVINGSVNLACRTQVHALGAGVVTIEPLPHLAVLQDLVVDMEPFLAKVRAVQPWLQPSDPKPEKERLVLPDQWGEAEPYTNCILCASCHGVCPAAEKEEYLGPAALAKHYRFLADPRDAAAETRLALVDGPAGVWGCEMVGNCVKVCPKGVPPMRGIGRTRARLKRKAKE